MPSKQHDANHQHSLRNKEAKSHMPRAMIKRHTLINNTYCSHDRINSIMIQDTPINLHIARTINPVPQKQDLAMIPATKAERVGYKIMRKKHTTSSRERLMKSCAKRERSDRDRKLKNPYCICSHATSLRLPCLPLPYPPAQHPRYCMAIYEYEPLPTTIQVANGVMVLAQGRVVQQEWYRDLIGEEGGACGSLLIDT